MTKTFYGLLGLEKNKCFYMLICGSKWHLKNEPDDAILFQRVNFSMVFLMKVTYLYATQSCYNFI